MLRHLCIQPKLLQLKSIFLNMQRNFKVAVIGAASGIGQPLALLLKRNPLVTDLTLYDLFKIPGIAMDVSHIDSDAAVKGFIKANQLVDALKCANIVVILADLPYKEGMTRDNLFKGNAEIVMDVCDVLADVCPDTLLAIVANPVNSIVPVAAEILKRRGCADPKRLFGVTTLDSVRTRTLVGNALKLNPQTIKIPVIGGHSGETIIPVFSECHPQYIIEEPSIEELTKRIQFGSTEVLNSTADLSSATLSVAYSTERFINNLLKGLANHNNVTDYSYVESCVAEARFFSSALTLGPKGIKDYLPLPILNSFEKKLLCEALPILHRDITEGEDFVKNELK